MSLNALLLCLVTGALLACPVAEASCASHVSTCTSSTGTVPSSGTSDQKCTYLYSYQVCLEAYSDCSNASAEVSSMQLTLSSPQCVGDYCTGSCEGSNQYCPISSCTCTSQYKESNGVCVDKVIGDSCSTFMDCPVTSYTCSNSICTCSPSYGNDGTGVCATSCADAQGYKGTVGSCVEKVAGDACTIGSDASCGSNQYCSSAGICLCVTGYAPLSNLTCAVYVDNSGVGGLDAGHLHWILPLGILAAVLALANRIIIPL